LPKTLGKQRLRFKTAQNAAHFRPIRPESMPSCWRSSTLGQACPMT
jgi:hypothetical protein